MSGTAIKPVVVGVDGSPSSDLATAWAADEATRRRVPLRVVHAFIWPLMHLHLGPGPDAPAHAGLRAEAVRILDDAKSLARSRHPELDVQTVLVTGMIVPVLLGESRNAQIVVLGSRGLGGFTGLLVGSVAVQMCAHASCPVIVTLATGTLNVAGSVVVGVDGSGLSMRAVAFAFEQADARGVPLIAVHAWTRAVSRKPGDMLPVVHDVDAVQEEERRVLAESLAGWSDKYPDVAVEQRLVHGHAAETLLAESGQAQLLVVGSRGRGGFRGLLLGSVSQAVLHHATSTVAVIR